MKACKVPQNPTQISRNRHTCCILITHSSIIQLKKIYSKFNLLSKIIEQKPKK